MSIKITNSKIEIENICWFLRAIKERNSGRFKTFSGNVHTWRMIVGAYKAAGGRAGRRKTVFNRSMSELTPL